MGATYDKVTPVHLPPVSIHAPVMGATSFNFPKIKLQFCFNPRARDGRDPANSLVACSYMGFNPRARDGRDLMPSLVFPFRTVSIHAPVMGATPTPSLMIIRSMFQSTRP